jgi:hypothetical protein
MLSLSMITYLDQHRAELSSNRAPVGNGKTFVHENANLGVTRTRVFLPVSQ